MALNLSNLETAEYREPLLAPVAPATIEPFDSANLLRAIAIGLGGAAIGALLYAGFIYLTHFEIGYLSIVVAFLIAKAMMAGSKGQGGRPYQIASLTLTCFSVAAANALLLYWNVSKDRPVRLSVHNLLALMRFGFEEPFLEFRESAAGALITLFILFIGLRAAWRMTSGDPNAVRHPFRRW
jgi:hypothetical protein